MQLTIDQHGNVLDDNGRPKQKRIRTPEEIEGARQELERLSEALYAISQLPDDATIGQEFRAAGLDPLSGDLMANNLPGLSFQGEDCRGLIFIGSNLSNCNFKGALICGARLELTTLTGTNLSQAKDYLEYMEKWVPPADKIPDVLTQSRNGDTFFDWPGLPLTHEFHDFGGGILQIGASREITMADWHAAAATLRRVQPECSIPLEVSPDGFVQIMKALTGKPYQPLLNAGNDHLMVGTTALQGMRPAPSGNEPLGFRVARYYLWD